MSKNMIETKALLQTPVPMIDLINTFVLWRYYVELTDILFSVQLL